MSGRPLVPQGCIGQSACGYFQLALGGALKRVFRFGETVRAKIAVARTCMRHPGIGIRRDCFLRQAQWLFRYRPVPAGGYAPP